MRRAICKQEDNEMRSTNRTDCGCRGHGTLCRKAQHILDSSREAYGRGDYERADMHYAVFQAHLARAAGTVWTPKGRAS